MKHIYLNLKRFDISPDKGGVNRLAPMPEWGPYIVRSLQASLKRYADYAEFVAYFPEAHILTAATAKNGMNILKLGSQSVHHSDTADGGNFGAFTTQRTANAVKEMGCEHVLIGHCEERADLAGILAEVQVKDTIAINRILNAKVRKATAAGLSVLYCIGETSEEQDNWQSVLSEQIHIGLKGIDKTKIVVAYEPVWSIGPGKIPADRDYITKVARFIKTHTGDIPVVYGGGLKSENAGMLAQIKEIDGGLVALTRFQGEIGFYPQEFLEIVRLYLDKCKENERGK